jgi:hypothetical protein
LQPFHGKSDGLLDQATEKIRLIPEKNMAGQIWVARQFGFIP